MKLSMILLAAGDSRRFGSNKLLYPVEGTPMYSRALSRLLLARQMLTQEEPLVQTALTVVTQYASIARDAEEKQFQVCKNVFPEKGISFSIRLGLEVCQGTEAALFCVGDQPWLTAESIRALVSGWLRSGRGMGCLSYGERLGNPCIFSRRYYQELLELRGDVGGKAVLLAHREDVFLLDAGKEKELEDIDRPFQ